MPLENIRIVLVNTKHPGNIGSTARAMKTMGLSKLFLVKPAVFPSEESVTLASGADDILQKAVIVDTLKEALLDCYFAVGASARVRGILLPVCNPTESMMTLLQEGSHHPVALVFGREDRGLTNEELQLCHQQVHIPAAEDFSSLNLASSVQVLAYELRKSFLAKKDQAESLNFEENKPLATIDDMEHLYAHMQQVMSDIGFFDHSSDEKIMAKMRRLYNKARPEKIEVNILRGILTEMQKHID